MSKPTANFTKLLAGNQNVSQRNFPEGELLRQNYDYDMNKQSYVGTYYTIATLCIYFKASFKVWLIIH